MTPYCTSFESVIDLKDSLMEGGGIDSSDFLFTSSYEARLSGLAIATYLPLPYIKIGSILTTLDGSE
ncbi:MAG: hypothetical protein V7K62_07480 [Nostoc sp.]